MRIIFPLDFSYTFVYTIFIILSTLIRMRRVEYGQLNYIRSYDILMMVCPVFYFLSDTGENFKNFGKP